MNVPAVLGGVTAAGLVLGGGTGAVLALKNEGYIRNDGLTTHEARDAGANALIGGGVGMAAGLFASRALPLTGFGGMMAGMLLGGAAYGAYTLAHNALD